MLRVSIWDWKWTRNRPARLIPTKTRNAHGRVAMALGSQAATMLHITFGNLFFDSRAFCARICLLTAVLKTFLMFCSTAVTQKTRKVKELKMKTFNEVIIMEIYGIHMTYNCNFVFIKWFF
jgi:hypothetical protein